MILKTFWDITVGDIVKVFNPVLLVYFTLTGVAFIRARNAVSKQDFRKELEEHKRQVEELKSRIQELERLSKGKS